MTKTYPDRDWINPAVEIRTSPIHGRGMFALRTLAPGDVIAIWGGPYVGKVAAEDAAAAGKVVQQIEDRRELLERYGAYFTPVLKRRISAQRQHDR